MGQFSNMERFVKRDSGGGSSSAVEVMAHMCEDLGSIHGTLKKASQCFRQKTPGKQPHLLWLKVAKAMLRALVRAKCSPN